MYILKANNNPNAYSKVGSEVLTINQLLNKYQQELKPEYNINFGYSIAASVIAFIITVLAFICKDNKFLLVTMTTIALIGHAIYMFIIVYAHTLKIAQTKSLDLIKEDIDLITYDKTYEFIKQNIENIDTLIKLLSSEKNNILLANLINIIADSKTWVNMPKNFQDLIDILQKANNIVTNNRNAITIIQSFDVISLSNSIDTINRIANSNSTENATYIVNENNPESTKYVIKTLTEVINDQNINEILYLSQHETAFKNIDNLVNITKTLDKFNINNSLQNITELLKEKVDNISLPEFFNTAINAIKNKNIVNIIESIMPLNVQIFQRIFLLFTTIANLKNESNIPIYDDTQNIFSNNEYQKYIPHMQNLFNIYTELKTKFDNDNYIIEYLMQLTNIVAKSPNKIVKYQNILAAPNNISTVVSQAQTMNKLDNDKYIYILQNIQKLV